MLTNKKILVIDNNKNDIAIIRLLLQGVEVIELMSFDGDISYIVKERPDCILLEYSLANSKEFINVLYKDTVGCEIPIIMLTENDSEELAIEITQRGACDYLIKGFFSKNTLSKSIFFAIERQKLINTVYKQKKELVKLTVSDELTGINNRRSLIGNIEKHIDLSRRYKFPLSLAICDIDKFKYINDTYGHIVGDSIIKEVANIIVSIIRKSDVAGRHGGDEFLVIFPNTSMRNALKGMEKIRSKVLQACQFSNKFQQLKKIGEGEEANSKLNSLEVTLSIGVAEYSPEFETADDFIAMADEALYYAKQNGRNAVAYKEDLKSALYNVDSEYAIPV